MILSGSDARVAYSTPTIICIEINRACQFAFQEAEMIMASHVEARKTAEL